jgi:hypothetical protein
LHHTAEGIEHGLGGKVFGWNKIDKVLLAVFLLQARGIESAHRRLSGWEVGHLFDDVEDGRVCFLEAGRQ